MNWWNNLRTGPPRWLSSIIQMPFSAHCNVTFEPWNTVKWIVDADKKKIKFFLEKKWNNNKTYN
jgi:hypothetical protein